MRRALASVPVAVVQLVAALVIGAGAGAGAVALVADHKAGQAADADQTLGVRAGDRLDEAVTALREDGVYVAPDGRFLVDEAGEAAIEAAVAAQEVPTYVIVWGPDPQIGVDPLVTEDVLVRDLPDEDGFVFVWEGPQQGSVLDVGPDGGYTTFGSASDFVGDPATTLVEAVSAVDRSDIYEDYGDSDYWGGVGGGSVLGFFIGAGIVGVVVAAAKILAVTRGRRRLLPGSWRMRPEDSA